MKGLLLKDYRMTLYYCRRYFLIALIFSGVFLGTGQTGVAVPYHTIVVAGIITTLLSYDERSGWDQYVSTLPCTRGQVVGSKYLMTLALQPALLGVQALVLMARNLSLGNPLLEGWEVLLLMLGVSMALVAIILPCLFWMGVERGRMLYYLAFILACAVAAIVMSLGSKIQFSWQWVLGLAVVLGFVLSWALSVKLYGRRRRI